MEFNLITVKVDTNDGDYNSEVSEISKENLELIKPLIEKIKQFKPYTNGNYTFHHNYPFGDCCRDDMGEKSIQELYDFDENIFDIFQEYLPLSEYGFHTIKEITICPIKEITILL